MRVRIPGFNLRLTAQSGQCFRFHQQENGYLLIAHGKMLSIEEVGDGLFDLSCDQADFDAIWAHYFDLGRDYAALRQLVIEDDGYLHKALHYAQGVRILRQQPFETLIAFIISQRKSIPAISTCMAQLAARFGEVIAPGIHAFPTPQALAIADEVDLAACGLGYRLPYVRGTARMIADGRINLEAMHALDDVQLHQQLQAFPGVGAKVASCVMLFAYARMDAFPVDVWIQKVLDAEFPEGFPFERYQGVLGILQQYLFCYARHEAGRL